MLVVFVVYQARVESCGFAPRQERMRGSSLSDRCIYHPEDFRFTRQIDQLAAEAHVGMQDAVPPERNRSLVRLLGHGTEQLRHLLRPEEASRQRTMLASRRRSHVCEGGKEDK